MIQGSFCFSQDGVIMLGMQMIYLFAEFSAFSSLFGQSLFFAFYDCSAYI
jgi:hypothetical protein